MPDATDLAAPLRRFAEQFDSHDGWTIDEDMDIYSWLLKSPDGSIKARCYARVTAERIAWLFNNDLELIAALERAPATDVDLAATLRELADATSATPWTVQVDRGDASVWRRPVRLGGDPEDRLIGDVWDEGNAQFVAWCRNNAEAVATALERGAAAEAVVAAVKLFNDHDEDDDTPYEATHLALVAYDALTEGKPT